MKDIVRVFTNVYTVLIKGDIQSLQNVSHTTMDRNIENQFCVPHTDIHSTTDHTISGRYCGVGDLTMQGEGEIIVELSLRSARRIS